MDRCYRTLIPIGLWLGLACFVLALVMMVVGERFLFRLTPGGILHAAQVLFLFAIGCYCAHRTTQHA